MVAAIENFMPKPMVSYTKFSNQTNNNLIIRFLQFKHTFIQKRK